MIRPPHIGRATFGATAKRDHFVDFNKMVSWFITSVLAGGYGFANDLGEVPSLCVSQQELQVTCTPELRSGFRVFPNHILKSRVQANDDFLIHKFFRPYVTRIS